MTTAPRRHLYMNVLLPCDYDCWYCFAPRRIRSPDIVPGVLATDHGRERLAAFLDRNGPWDLSLIGSGEIGLLPGLDELVTRVAADVRISMITNLSTNAVLDAILARKAMGRLGKIQASLHPEADIPTFWRRIARLKEAGIAVFVACVGVPSQLRRVEGLAEKCRALDVPFYLQVHIGPYKNKQYPWAYEDEQRELIERHTWDAFNYRALHGHLGLADDRLTECGSTRFAVYQFIDEGAIYSCSNRHRAYGNWIEGHFEPHPEPRPCHRVDGRCYYGIGIDDARLQRRHQGDFTRSIPAFGEAEKEALQRGMPTGQHLGSLPELWPPRVTRITRRR